MKKPMLIMRCRAQGPHHDASGVLLGRKESIRLLNIAIGWPSISILRRIIISSISLLASVTLLAIIVVGSQSQPRLLNLDLTQYSSSSPRDFLLRFFDMHLSKRAFLSFRDPPVSRDTNIHINHSLDVPWFFRDDETFSTPPESKFEICQEIIDHDERATQNDHNDINISAPDYDILHNITTQINGYDPLSVADANSRERFIPILEARGLNDNDKDEFGHRRDTLPIAQAVADHQNDHSHLHAQSAVLQFLEEEDGMNEEAVRSNAALYQFLKKTAQGIIVRNNPGTLSATSQKRCDDMLRDLSDNGLMIMTHPDVSSTLGAKDSLVKIKDLKCGLKDTEVYYTPEAFGEGFRQSIALHPRVIKQNRGSQGEGVWIVQLEDESAYCSAQGECPPVTDDTRIVLMEAWDNHVEHHTVGEFLEFCINGRTDKSGSWTSTGQGRYFDGGLEAGSMVVDQRFLPRITEGEVRCLFVGSELVEIVHKKPKEGGLSATLASGAIYTKYSPDDEKFATLVQHLKEDVPRIMESFDMAHQPLPLLWTADYIYGDTDDELYVGEINCSCPGITQQLGIVPVIAKVALETVFHSDLVGVGNVDDVAA